MTIKLPGGSEYQVSYILRTNAVTFYQNVSKVFRKKEPSKETVITNAEIG